MTVALVTLASIVGILVVGAGVYLIVSFALMARHVPRRSFHVTFAEMLREALWVTLTQPLLPFYYLAGRRMANGSGVPIVFVHGYFQNRVGFIYLARSLRKRALGPIYGFNYLWLRDIPSIAAELARFIESVTKETGAEKVDVVCHSMGGLVAAEYLARCGGVARVRRWVTIATPHRGIVYRGPILGRAKSVLRSGHGLATLPEVPLLSVYSTHDNVVHPITTSKLDGPLAENLEVGAVGHLAILFSPETAAATARFLSASAPKEAAISVVS